MQFRNGKTPAVAPIRTLTSELLLCFLLLRPHRKREKASRLSEDTPEMAALKASLRLRIASLDVAIRDQNPVGSMVSTDSAALTSGPR